MSATVAAPDVLLWQHESAWQLLTLLLAEVTDDECLWAPTPDAWTLRPTGNGRWLADWADQEPDPAPAPAPATSIGWLTWHIGWWWSDVTGRAFGTGAVAPADVTWPGSADAARGWLADLHARWRRELTALPAQRWSSVELADRCWPLRDRPFTHVAAWVNAELMKNTAEIGVTRRLYAAHQRSGGAA